ncbi:hypothetical protein ACF1AY_34855 [Streptomyces sp. NPDC014776]|uniref:hypothetical protein n=1 Tax=unclassified Streptomyces TaxID=2593676 RepID=UPI0036F5B5FE
MEDKSALPWPTGHPIAEHTPTTHATVHALLKAGHSRRAIQRQLRMAHHAVKKYADAAGPEDLFAGQWQNRTSVLDEYKTYLDDRWNDGCTNAWKPWEEIVPLGPASPGTSRLQGRLHAAARPGSARPPPVTFAGVVKAQ